jgi:hypothetical protein
MAEEESGDSFTLGDLVKSKKDDSPSEPESSEISSAKEIPDASGDQEAG